MVYAFDSTTIDLCLTLFPWAKFRRHKAAVKLHTLLDLRGSIPTFIKITSGAVHDVNILDDMNFEAGAFYIMDKGYVDYSRLYVIEQSKSYFVTRAKENFNFKRVLSHPVNKKRGIICDQFVKLKGYYAAKDYPDMLRRIKYHDKELNKTFTFLTNNIQLSAVTIAALYKERWKVELFFKWVKQHLRIKAFYGTSSNAVYTQIWIAISIYLIVAIMKKKMKLDQSLYTILQILSVNLFEKTPISQVFQEKIENNPNDGNSNQLIIFDL
jgi:IS4 transposase